MSPHEPRCLVLDEDINWKLGKELRYRGLRKTTSISELGLNEKVDGQIIKALSEQHEPCVLVTWDNKMAKSHAGQLAHFGLTVAMVDLYADRGGLTDEEYYREVIHRWAHRMIGQEKASVVKYTRLRWGRLKLKVPQPALAAA